MANSDKYLSVAEIIENVTAGLASYESLPKRVKKIEEKEDDESCSDT